jgi:hypothetical protein
LYNLGLIDAIIPEPLGGAHRNMHDTVYKVESYIARTLAELRRMKIDDLLESRYRKWRSVGTSCAVRTGKRPQPGDRIVSTPGPARARRGSSPAKV